jgi:hypothetical protein
MDQKKKLSAKEIVADIWNCLDDDALMAKYELSRKQLEAVLKKLVAAGHISQADLDARGRISEEQVEVEPDFSSLPEPDSGVTQKPAAAAFDPPTPVEPESVAPSYTVRAAIGISLGILLPIIGAILSATFDPLLGKLIMLVGTGSMLWGCYCLVKMKGYHWALSLLGLLGCFGLLVLLIIPNKNKPGGSWNPALVAAVIAGAGFIFVCFMGIVLAIAIPYYVSYKRTVCDRSAARDVVKLGAAMERLGHELRDGFVETYQRLREFWIKHDPKSGNKLPSAEA